MMGWVPQKHVLFEFKIKIALLHDYKRLLPRVRECVLILGDGVTLGKVQRKYMFLSNRGVEETTCLKRESVPKERNGKGGDKTFWKGIER
ncbi:hypothetical protein TNCT_481251 [Trichonephila clavata]|uniref:Uncharacterized protein n=1 Tax=Trichonephila clavata TaxID=2740835 RepID=A0A8X6KGR1_TRICU|nr:hypothetical protein TNCT_481251 [Trichonephila clavata]